MINKDDLLTKTDQWLRATNYLPSYQAAEKIRDLVVEYFEPMLVNLENRAQKSEANLAEALPVRLEVNGVWQEIIGAEHASYVWPKHETSYQIKIKQAYSIAQQKAPESADVIAMLLWCYLHWLYWADDCSVKINECEKTLTAMRERAEAAEATAAQVQAAFLAWKEAAS